MRCECCDAALSNSESTARFADADKDAPRRYVNLCKECQGFLPSSVTIITRHDVSEESFEDLFDHESEDTDGYEE